MVIGISKLWLEKVMPNKWNNKLSDAKNENVKIKPKDNDK